MIKQKNKKFASIEPGNIKVTMQSKPINQKKWGDKPPKK